MTFAELKKIVNPEQRVSVSTIFDNGKFVEHGLTIDHNKSIGDKEAFPDQVWFDALEVRWMSVCNNILLIELLEVEEES